MSLNWSRNICCAKSKGAVGHSTITRWLKTFRSNCKNLNYQVRPERPKIADSEAVFQVIEAKLASSPQRLSGEVVISQFSEVCPLHDHLKLPNCASRNQNIVKLLTQSRKSRVMPSTGRMRHKSNIFWSFPLYMVTSD